MYSNMCIKICVISFILVSSAVCAKNVCRNGSNCKRVTLCEAIYGNLQTNNKQLFVNLLRELHCGFDTDGTPMICCPPFLTLNETLSGADLLPNTTVCGIQNDNRIVGGTQTEIDEHPWMALLKYTKPKGSGYYCGGVLISSRYVLTAAHCIKGADLPSTWSLNEVRLGEWNLKSNEDCNKDDCALPVVNVPVEEVIAHEKYNAHDGNQQHDIALIRLAHEVNFTDFVKPICLPYTSEFERKTFEGLTMEVAGWGKTETKSTSDVKLKVRLPVIRQDDCKDVYSAANRVITDKQMCAGGVSGEDSCRGDSGGPLMGQDNKNNKGNWFAVGIVSYGPSPCGTIGWPGVYTRVTHFTDWIINNMRA
ncbi:CLIP domain-containing serine protease 2-like isoform X1 [Colias croceus]|uniref:CLIP domain-containing serine protease 2-like isoform X1 n=2 Tax=Colias crocea TaxID=72248 RepID=UPI001E279DD9|nr:CLIP domain-containing serine protease 2-like isoform X1 [Colias croceus]